MAFKRELKAVACITSHRRRRRLEYHLLSNPKLGWDPPLSGSTHCPNPYHAAPVLPPLSLLPLMYHACMTQHSFARHSVCHTYLCSATDAASTASGPRVAAMQPNITAIQDLLLLAHGDCRQKAEPIAVRSLPLGGSRVPKGSDLHSQTTTTLEPSWTALCNLRCQTRRSSSSHTYQETK